MFAHIMKEGNSKQSWLGSVALCPCCNSQQPKAEFKCVNDVEICKTCQVEAVDLLVV